MPAPGRWSKRTGNVKQGSVLIPSYGRSSRFGHEADHLIAAPSGPEREDDQRLYWSSAWWSPPPESNRRPHPYHGTTGNRCAERHSRRSRSTVRVKVMGSASTQLCGHSRHQSSPQYGSSRQSVTAASAASRIAAPSTSRRDDGIPRSGQVQMNASGPGGGRGRAR
jgi:hypothetical protein